MFSEFLLPLRRNAPRRVLLMLPAVDTTPFVIIAVPPNLQQENRYGAFLHVVSIFEDGL